MMGTSGTPSRSAAMAEADRDREIEAISQAMAEGECDGAELERRCDGRRWGPRRFRSALQDAIDEGRIRRLPSGRYDAGERR
jgi:hypothetical protein